MPRDQWEAVWPYVDNIWVKNKTRSSKDGGSITRYYLCQNNATKAWVSKVKPGEGQRQRLARDTLGCGMRFKSITTAFSVTATRTGECLAHCHDLELLDSQKKNSGIMALAAQEASRGYKISAVAETITARHRPQEWSILKDLGGHWLTLADVHNSAAAHKSAHPDLWIGQPGTMVGEIRKAGTCDIVEENEILVEQPEETESRQARKPLTKEQWLERKAAEWDKMEERRLQAMKDSQLRKGQGLPPKGSRKRVRRTHEERYADAPFEWED